MPTDTPENKLHTVLVVDGFGGWVGGLMSPGDLNDLLVNGVIKGVGAVVIFLPQKIGRAHV